MIIQIITLNNIVETFPTGEQRILKKNIPAKRYIHKENIYSVSEHIGDTGRIYKTRCIINTTEGEFIIKMRPEVAKELLLQPIKIKGFGR